MSEISIDAVSDAEENTDRFAADTQWNNVED